MTEKYARALCKDKIHIYMRENGPCTIEYPSDQIINKGKNQLSYIDRELAEALALLIESA